MNNPYIDNVDSVDKNPYIEAIKPNPYIRSDRKMIDVSTSNIDPNAAKIEQQRLDATRTYFESGQLPWTSLFIPGHQDKLKAPEPPGGFDEKGNPIDEYGKPYTSHPIKAVTSGWDIESANKLMGETSKVSRGIVTGIKSFANSLGTEVADISVDLYGAFDEVARKHPVLSDIFKPSMAISETAMSMGSGIMSAMAKIPVKYILIAQGMSESDAEELSSLKALSTTYQPYTESGKMLTETASKVLGFTFEAANKLVGKPAAQMIEQSVIGDFISYIGGNPRLVGLPLEEIITLYLGSKGLGAGAKFARNAKSSIRTAIEAKRIEKYSQYTPSANPPPPYIPAMPINPQISFRDANKEEIDTIETPASGIDPDIIRKAKEGLDEILQTQDELSIKDEASKVVVDTQADDVIKEELKIKGKKVKKAKTVQKLNELEQVKEEVKPTPTEELTALREKFNNKEIKAGDYIKESKKIKALIDAEEVGKETKVITRLDELTGTPLPKELNTESSPFRDKSVKYTNTMSKLFNERVKSTTSSPETYTRYLINEVNRYLNGEEVSIDKIRDNISDLATRTDELRMNFDEPEHFNSWKDTVNEAAKWARGAERKVEDKQSGTTLRMGIDPTLIKPFYSKLKKSLEELKFGKMDIEQLKKTMKGKQVSDAEIEQMLGGLKGNVTKQNVLDEVKVNSTEFEDVILGEPTFKDLGHRFNTAEERNIWLQDVGRWDDFINGKLSLNEDQQGFFVSEVIENKSIRDIVTQLARDLENGLITTEEYYSSIEATGSEDVGSRAGFTEPVKFSMYQEPGSVPGSYREMFVTAPNIIDKSQAISSLSTKPIKIREQLYNEGMITEEEFKTGRSTNFIKWQDGHEDYNIIKNPIVRIRYNDRIIEGKRILFIEEMQSPTKNEIAKMPSWLSNRVYDIGVKRVLALAKEEGYDGVSWTTGEMQAGRYDLSKQLDSVMVSRHLDNSFTLRGFKDDKLSIEQNRIMEDKLSDYIGKDLTSKVMKDLQRNKLGSKVYNGLDLKIGGEGLKYLYDKQLPSLFKKYGKEEVRRLPFEERYALDKLPPNVSFIPITKNTPTTFSLYSGIPVDKISKVATKLGQNFARGMKESQELKEFNIKVATKLFRKKYTASFVERSGNTARILSNTPGNVGYDLKASMYLTRGGHPKALRVFDQMRDEVDSGLSIGEKDIKNGLIKALRILDIAKYKNSKQFTFPKNSKPKEADAYVKDFMYKKINGVKDLTPEEAYRLYHINEDGSIGGRVGAYFNWTRKAIKDAFDGELITERDMQDLISHNYRKIRLVDIFDNKEDVKLGSKTISVYDSGIERLQKGKVTDIYEPDSNVVALETFNTLYSRIFKNRANRDLYDLALEDENNPFVRIKKSKGVKIPENFRHYTAKVFIDGKPKTIFLADDIGPEWISSNAQVTYKYAQFVRYASGTPLVKLFATGINQAFALRNLPRDAFQLWFTSRIRRDVSSKIFGKYQSTFSPNIPIGAYQLLRQYKKVTKDATLRVGSFDDFIDDGGGMELLTAQGKILFHGKHLEPSTEAFYKYLSFLGRTSETMSRLAIRGKVIETRALDRGKSIEDAYRDKKIRKEATFTARDFMDFSQGGDIIKAADNAIPYLNPKLVAMRGFLRTFKDQPVVAAYKLIQFAMLVGGVYIGNQMLHPKTMKDLDGDRRTQGNLVFPLGDFFGFKDAMNDTRYPFIMIPISQSMKFFKTLFEGGIDIMTGKPVDSKRIVQSLKDFAPADVTTLPPTISGGLGYVMNEDFWLGKNIVPEKEGPFDYQLPKWLVGGKGGSENEWTGKTSQAAKDLGAATGLSPDRLKYLMGQLITNDNLYAQILGKAYQEAFGQLPEKDRKFILAESLSKVPVIKSFFGITNPYSKFADPLQKAADKATLDRFIEDTGLDGLVEAFLYDKTVTRSRIEKYIRSFKDIDTRNRLHDDFQFQEDIKDLSNRYFWLSLKRISSVKVRAEEYVRRIDSLDEDERRQMLIEEDIVDRAGGVVSKEFWNKVLEVRSEKK